MIDDGVEVEPVIETFDLYGEIMNRNRCRRSVERFIHLKVL